MAAIKGKDTKPEIVVRRALHAAGLRFRLHCRDLPGRPDIVLPRYRTVVFVHGCFWHHHSCDLFVWPKTRAEFWRAPIESLLDRKTAAVGMCSTVGWLEWAATNGGGPVLTKIGRSARYRKSDVLAWLDSNCRRIRSTADLRDGSEV